MFQRYPPLRELRCAVLALFLATGLEAVWQIASVGLSSTPFHLSATLFHASLVFLLTFALLWHSNLKTAGGPTTSSSTPTSKIASISASPPFAGDQCLADGPGTVLGLRKLQEAEDSLREREEEYRLLVASVPEVVWKTDAMGNVVFVSPQVEALLGYSADEFRQHGDSLWFKSVHPDDQEHVGKAFEALLHEGKAYDIECRARKKNGEWFWAHDRAVATNDAHGLRGATGIISDISVRKAGEESEKRYLSLFENMLEGFAYCEMLFDDHDRPVDFVYLAVNHAFGKLTGLHDVVGKKFSEIVPDGQDSQAELFERYSRVIRTSQPDRFEIEIKAMAMWFSISAYSAGKACFIATFDNITKRKQAEESLLFQTALLEAQAETTIDGILAVDESDQIVLANKQFGLNFDIPDEVLSTRNDLIVRKHVTAQVKDPDAFVERVKYLNSHRDEKSRDELRLINGKVFDRYSAPLIDAKGRYRGRIWYFRDITARTRAEERVEFLAYYDGLTRLPNRTLFQDLLAKSLAGARRAHDKVALLFLDLDRFKDINDSLGHSVGDLLLQEVAERLKTWGREQDTVARLSGDEFLITLTHIKDLPDAAVAAERLMDTHGR